MRITASDWILLGHAGMGMLGGLLAGWVFFEALHASKENASRTRKAAVAVALSMGAVWILGEHWYIHEYPADRALFFMTLILSFYLPIAAWDRLYANAAARRMVLCVSLVIVLSALAIEGAGA